MWAFLAALAGILAERVASGSAEHMSEVRAKFQHNRDIHMEMAKMLDPQTPTFGYEGANFDAQQAQRRAAFSAQTGSKVASLLPAAVNTIDTYAEPSSTDADNTRTANLISAYQAIDRSSWKPPSLGLRY